jgi:hypothetical protein
MLAVLLKAVCCQFLSLFSICLQLCKKIAYISPNIETKNLQSRVPHVKLRVAQQIFVFYES